MWQGAGPCQCHPSVGKTRPPGGCLPKDVLIASAKALNLDISLKSDPKSLRVALGEAVGAKLCEERTFLMKLPLSTQQKTDYAKKYLRPAMPHKWLNDPDMWLDSNDITAVMEQYEDAYPDFEFMGPFPIDFAAPNPYQTGGTKKCLMTEICEFKVQGALTNGTKSLGIVYNLDPHYKSGSHWVATYVDLIHHECLYFDSYGMEPPKQIEKFMRWLTTQDPKMKLSFNAKRFQFKNTECGMYSLFFIIRMLMGDKFPTFNKSTPKDDGMLKLRKCLFSI